jgi:Ni/Co efflux regulator RcnB
MRSRYLPLALVCLALAAPAQAGGHKSNDGHPGRGHKSNDGHPGRGWGVGEVPPGHAKRYSYATGDRLPRDGWIIIDPYRYRLPPLRPGEAYVRTDNQIFRIARDTATVIEALGIVSDWLN